MSDNVVSIPEPFSTIIDKVTKLDRLSFEQGAPKSGFERPYFWGEMYPFDPPQSEARLYAVLVKFVEEGARTRELRKYSMPPYTEATIGRLSKILESVSLPWDSTAVT